MNIHTLWWLTFLFIKDFSCNQNNPFVLENVELTAKEGSCIEIKCEKEAGQPNSYDGSWFWMKNPVWDDTLKEFNGTIVYSKHENHNVSSLFKNRVSYNVDSSKLGPESVCHILICNLNKSDSGNYSFRYVEEKVKWVTNPVAALTVLDNPCLITFETPPVVVENNEVTLTCSTLKSCPSELKIDQMQSLSKVQIGDKTSENVASKTIRYSFKTNWMVNGAEFSCQTSDNEDKYLIKNVTLTVEYAPQDVRAVSSPESVKEGDSVTLTCSAKAQPNVTFNWFENNMFKLSGTEMKITSAKDSDTGSYHCKANNTHGSKESNTLNITVSYAPEVYVTGSPSTVKEGERISLTCHVKRSQPSPHLFVWYKNGAILKTAKQNIFLSVQRKDSGTYTCKATNTVGSGTSRSFHLNVQYKPRSNVAISGSYINNEVRVNSRIIFTCNTEANPEPHYSWFSYKQSNPTYKTHIGYDQSFTLASVQRADEACYTCNASNSIGAGETSEPMCIRVRFPPTNLMLNMDDKVREGQSVTISCSAESFPSSAFILKHFQSQEWHDIWNSQTSNNHNTIRHSFTASPADAGRYICIASNSENTTQSQERILVVEYVPKDVTVLPSPGFVVKENDSISLECKATSDPPAEVFTWFKDEMAFNNKKQKYFIHSASPADSGQYSCRAENKIGAGNSRKIDVKVKYAPKQAIIIKGTDRQLNDGTRVVEMICKSDSYPDATYSWYSKTKGPLSTGKTFKVNSEKGGEYYCVAKNEMGEKFSDLFKPFPNTKMIVFLVLFLLVFIPLLLFMSYRCTRKRYTQQGTVNTWPCSSFLARWTIARERNTRNEMGLVEPFRSRDDLLTDQPCRLNAQRHQRGSDVTSASNINTIYCTVNPNPTHLNQATSAQQPARQQGGHTEDDSLNYASLHFPKKQNSKLEEVAIYSKVSKLKLKPSEENDKGVMTDYENISPAHSVYPFDLYESDTDTSEDEEEVNYTKVNIRQQRAKTNSSSSEDTTEYSQVKT